MSILVNLIILFLPCKYFSCSFFHYSIQNFTRFFIMLSPNSQRNGRGETPSPSPHHPRNFHPHHHPFHSTVSIQKLKRFNLLILTFRASTFCFSLASSIFTLTNSRGSGSLHWYDFDSFRYVFAANAIVAIYSLFEMSSSVWEITRGATLFPEVLQVWFDFGHDQVFAYLLLSADSAATALVKTMKKDTCTANNAFCVQAYVGIALGFAGFLFLGLSSLLSGFRVVCFLINGSRFYV